MKEEKKVVANCLHPLKHMTHFSSFDLKEKETQKRCQYDESGGIIT